MNKKIYSKKSFKITSEFVDIIDIVSNWIDYNCYIRRIPCVSLGIISGDKLIYTGHFGFKNLKTKELATNNTAYRIASISKLFTAVAIMQLVQEKKLNLDDLVSEHLDWFKSNSDKNLSEITVRNILFHCSGLTRESGSYWIDDKFPNLESIKQFISDSPTAYTPLEKWKYSNLGFGILGAIIEKISGKTYPEYVKKNILDRLNMDNSAPDWNFASKIDLATGYSRDIPDKLRMPFANINTNSLAAATGFVSTVPDLSNFIISLFNDQILLPNNLKKEMLRIQWEKDASVKWGLGVYISKLKDTTIYGHSGGFPGYITSIGYSKEFKIGIIVLTNCIDGAAQGLLNTSFNISTGIINNYSNYNSDKKINLNKYIGRFQSRWGVFEIRKINNTLVMFDSNSPDPLANLSVLTHQDKDVFLIKSGDGFGRIGELMQFIFDKGKVTKVRVGASESEILIIER
jgi:CubicO group peptidase (beta-lactamase class C family)